MDKESIGIDFGMINSNYKGLAITKGKESTTLKALRETLKMQNPQYTNLKIKITGKPKITYTSTPKNLSKCTCKKGNSFNIPQIFGNTNTKFFKAFQENFSNQSTHLALQPL